jgi:hypothetical protein
MRVRDVASLLILKSMSNRCDGWVRDVRDVASGDGWVRDVRDVASFCKSMRNR